MYIFTTYKIPNYARQSVYSVVDNNTYMKLKAMVSVMMVLPCMLTKEQETSSRTSGMDKNRKDQATKKKRLDKGWWISFAS